MTIYNKMSKSQLIKVCEAYDFNLDVLEVMLTELSDVNLEDVHQWLDQTKADIQTNLVMGLVKINSKWEQLNLFDKQV